MDPAQLDTDEGQSADDALQDELQEMKEEHDQVLFLNYHNLRSLPDKLLKEAKDFRHVTRIYLKKNLLQTLVSCLSTVVALHLMVTFIS